MPRKEKFREYEYETKTTTIRIPDLKNLDKEKQLRKAIDDFVLEYLNLKANTILSNDQIRLLRSLYNFMSNKMDFSETPDNKDIELIKTVKEVIA